MPVTDTERHRIEDAVMTLASYSSKPMEDYVRSHPRPRIPVARFKKDQLRDAIRDALMGELVRNERYELSLDALIADRSSRRAAGDWPATSVSVPSPGGRTHKPKTDVLSK
jgi:hypothetical protein